MQYIIFTKFKFNSIYYYGFESISKEMYDTFLNRYATFDPKTPIRICVALDPKGVSEFVSFENKKEMFSIFSTPIEIPHGSYDNIKTVFDYEYKHEYIYYGHSYFRNMLYFIDPDPIVGDEIFED